MTSDYLNVAHSTAQGGAYWYAWPLTTDGGGNTGWIFTAAPTSAGSH